MPKVNLSGMSVEALMDLRKRVEEALVERRTVLEKQLETLLSAKGLLAGGVGQAD